MTAPSYSITLEEHTSFPSLGSEGPLYDSVWEALPDTKLAVADHSAGRIADMDSGHVSYQIISHLPGLGSNNPDGCRKANNEMAEAVKKNPTRLGGFAALPMAYPDKAAAELERTVKELGFLGALIDSHLEDGTHYDAERFWPVFETAERLDVPIYIHPAPYPDAFVKQRYSGNYDAGVALGLSTTAWGWHEDVGLHILKLFSAGLFTRFPNLKIIIGHMGEMIPMMIDRIQKFRLLAPKIQQSSFGDVWDRNIWVTSSGIFSVGTLEMLLKVTKKDRVMYSVDTPFSRNIEGWNYLQELAEKSSLSKEELDDFAYGNAKRLLKLDVALRKF
ncbi:amidohydrolase 2 [Hypoxylon sp. FL1857]|nr:amidohydrolase 2 [Hypoxylon sp. FL1857]